MRYLKKYIGNGKFLNRKALMLTLGSMAVNFGTASAAELPYQDMTVKVCSSDLQGTQYIGLCDQDALPVEVHAASNQAVLKEIAETEVSGALVRSCEAENCVDTAFADKADRAGAADSGIRSEKESISMEAVSVGDAVQAVEAYSPAFAEKEYENADVIPEAVLRTQEEKRSESSGMMLLQGSNITADTFFISKPENCSAVSEIGINSQHLSSVSLDRPYLRTLDRDNPMLISAGEESVSPAELQNAGQQVSLLDSRILNRMEMRDTNLISGEQVQNIRNTPVQEWNTISSDTLEKKTISKLSAEKYPADTGLSRGYNYSHLLQPSAYPAPMSVKGVMSSVLPFSVEARFYAPHLNARVSSDKISYMGGAVDMKNTLGFGNSNAPELIFKYKRLSLDYIHVHGTGSNTLTGGNLTFDGKQFSGNVNAKSDFDYFRLKMDNPILSAGDMGLDWSYGLAAIHWSGTVHGKDSLGNEKSASKSFWVPIPMIGIGAHAALDPAGVFKAYGNISGLPLGGYGHFYDLEAGLCYTPMPFLGVTAGYRRIDIKVHHGSDEANISMNGPFAGLKYSF